MPQKGLNKTEELNEEMWEALEDKVQERISLETEAKVTIQWRGMNSKSAKGKRVKRKNRKEKKSFTFHKWNIRPDGSWQKGKIIQRVFFRRFDTRLVPLAGKDGQLRDRKTSQVKGKQGGDTIG